MITKKKVLMMSGILVTALCVYLILVSAAGFVNPYISVSEVSADTPGFLGKHIQMIGKVVNGSIQVQGGDATFQIADENTALNVIYAGATPQNFRENIDVVVIGSLISENIFNAQEILTKCPSKYE